MRMMMGGTRGHRSGGGSGGGVSVDAVSAAKTTSSAVSNIVNAKSPGENSTQFYWSHPGGGSPAAVVVYVENYETPVAAGHRTASRIREAAISPTTRADLKLKPVTGIHHHQKENLYRIFRHNEPVALDKGAALDKLKNDLTAALLRASQAGLSSPTIADILEARAERHATTARSSYVTAPTTVISAPKDNAKRPSGPMPTLARIAAAIAGR